ncbi:hypothetical protein GCM10014715_16250 [Streptomyces spiralis]|uniref:Uncharacterized protein n=1 Tax=Streptomyces spiralis TaxID=66376 RepID=A0A919DNZ6_9ACTN|nr:hypothetical protein GCM10014715_16250 [Streptomyces spiralis]
MDDTAGGPDCGNQQESREANDPEGGRGVDGRARGRGDGRMRRRSGSGNGTVTIRYSWWGAEERAKKINQTIALFEKKYPKIRVKTDFQTYQSFWEEFQTQASGGNPPDVFQNAVTFLRKYDKRGVLLDLKPQIQAGNLKLDDFRAGVTEVGEVDGKQPGISGRLQHDGPGDRQ